MLKKQKKNKMLIPLATIYLVSQIILMTNVQKYSKLYRIIKSKIYIVLVSNSK